MVEDSKLLGSCSRSGAAGSWNDSMLSSHHMSCHHDPYDLHAPEGLAGMKQTIESTRQAFPDIELTVQEQIAEDDKVVTRWRAQMTHSGERAGLTPTSKEITITGITIDRFENRLIVEAWRSMDSLALHQAIGTVEPT